MKHISEYTKKIMEDLEKKAYEKEKRRASYSVGITDLRNILKR